MSSSRDEALRDRWEQLIHRWQGPIYGYVLRMLRDEAAAADVTQEVFAEAVRHLHRIGEEVERPWLYKVAMNRVYRHFRETSRRREKEHQAAMKETTEQGRDPLEARDDRDVLEDHVHRLPEESRSLILLHYYGGLSQREMATMLGVPRTTIASRLKSAVATLRKGLIAGGCIAVASRAEALMRTMPAVPVPETLAGSLLGLGTGTGAVVGSAATSALTYGGILMSQKIWIGVGIVSVVTFIGGFGIGRSGHAELRSRVGDQRAELEDASLTRERLRTENEKLATQLEGLEERGAKLARDLLETSAKLADAEKSRAQDPADSDAEEPALGPGGIDWSELGDVIRANRHIALAVCEEIAKGGGSRSLSPELQAGRMEVIGAISAAAAKARLASPYPILDEEMLPEIMDVYLGALLDLSEQQVAEVQSIALELRRGHDLADDATPLEAYGVRRAMMEGLDARLGDVLDEDQASVLSKIGPIWDEMKMGTVRNAWIGVDAPGLHETLSSEWQKHYRFDEDQREQSGSILSEYAAAARSLLNSYDLLGGRAPTQAERERLMADLADLQLRYERSILAMLTAEQRGQLQNQHPLLIQFRPGGDVRLDTADAPGF